MKSFKKTKPKNPTILQQQSNKLKQKLELLKQQVTQKKQQKQMNKTATSLQQHNDTQQNRALSFNTKNNTQYSNFAQKDDNKLLNVLSELKIENILQKLKEKGIKNYQNFIQLTEQQIDQWKDMVLGYRLKMKKYIKQIKLTSSNLSNYSISQNKNSQKQSNQMTNSIKKQQKQRNIQDIIKQRGFAKIFVPLQRQYDNINDYDNYQVEQITQQDQDIIIQSFMNIFQPRKGILKPSLKETGKQKNRKIMWSKQVDIMQKQFQAKNHKRYPKQSIDKQALLNFTAINIGSQQSIPQNQSSESYKYCWKCFRKILIKQNICFRVSKEDKNKYFCSQKCQDNYQQEMEIFTQKIQTSLINPRKQQQNSQDQYNQEDLEIIDLQIC